MQKASDGCQEALDVSAQPFKVARHRARAAVLATAAALAILPSAAPAASEEARAVYDVSFGGIGIARGSLAVRIDKGAYAAKLHISTSGLARIVSSEESFATAKGRFGNSLTPASYELMSRGDKVTQVSMGLSGGKVRNLSAIPELAPKDDRVPLKNSHKRNVLDPLSAALVPVAIDADPAKACDRTLPIFDGWTRYDIRLSYKGTKAIDVPGYKGDAVICGARWVPVAGHREGRESTKFMANNRDLEAWFVPATDEMMLPYKISVKTMKGMLVVTARQFDGPIKGVAQAN